MFLQERKTVMKRKNNVNGTNKDDYVKSNVSKDAIDFNKGRKLVGVVNSMRGNKKNPWCTSM